MDKISGRLNDERLERHIEFLSAHVLSAIQAGEGERALMYEAARLAAIRCRSPEQVARLEREKGLS